MEKATQTKPQTEAGPEIVGISSARFWVRNWPCAICGKNLLYDACQEVRRCDCGPIYGKISDSCLQENFKEVK